jgi:hypothetical protein
MAEELNGRRIAFLVANEGVEQVELIEPWKAIQEAGAETEPLTLDDEKVQAFITSTRATRSGRTASSPRRAPTTTTVWCCREASPTPTSVGLHRRRLGGDDSGWVSLLGQGESLPDPRQEAAGAGALAPPDSRLAGAARGLLLSQQRLDGLRTPQRPGIALAGYAVREPGIPAERGRRG